MTEKSEQPEAMYCLGCYYRLDHLESSECPECGRGFDPSDPKTIAYSPKPKWPRWECLLAALLLAVLFYLTYEWWALDGFWGKRRTVSWNPHSDPNYVPFVKALMRSREIMLVIPLLVAIPGLLFSAIRHAGGNRATWVIALLLFVLFAIWPGTWTAIRDLPGALEILNRLNPQYK